MLNRKWRETKQQLFISATGSAWLFLSFSRVHDPGTVEPANKTHTWLREISPCFCLIVVPYHAWQLLLSLLNKIPVVVNIEMKLNRISLPSDSLAFPDPPAQRS